MNGVIYSESSNKNDTVTKIESTTDKSQPRSKINKVGDVLFVFLVLSIIFEVALTPIYNWRYFLARWENKGVKTPLTIILALLIFWKYDLDILRDILVALEFNARLTFPGQVITAFLIAGGSDGIYRIFTKLNIRLSPTDRDKKAKQARTQLEETKRKNLERKAS